MEVRRAHSLTFLVTVQKAFSYKGVGLGEQMKGGATLLALLLYASGGCTTVVTVSDVEAWLSSLQLDQVLLLLRERKGVRYQ